MNMLLQVIMNFIAGNVMNIILRVILSVLQVM